MANEMGDLGDPVGLLGRPSLASAGLFWVLYWRGDPYPFTRADRKLFRDSTLVSGGEDDPLEGYLTAGPHILKRAASFGVVYWVGGVVWRGLSDALVDEARLTNLILETEVEVHPYREGILLVGDSSTIRTVVFCLAERFLRYALTVTDPKERFDLVQLVRRLHPHCIKAWVALFELAPDDEVRARLWREFVKVFRVPLKP